jgi:hypothetical protein
MRLYLMVFAASCAVGYMAFSLRQGRAWWGMESMEDSASQRAKSARESEEIAEFENLLMSDDEKFERELSEAKSLSALLGLAEKQVREGYESSNELDQIAHRLAELYPAEALAYYAARPTHAEMNLDMYYTIIRAWSLRDWVACISYFDQDATLTTREFCERWDKTTDEFDDERPPGFLQVFGRLSEERQKALMDYLSPDEKAFLLPVIRDKALRAEIEDEQRIAQQKASEAATKPKESTPTQADPEQRLVDDLSEQWKKDPPDVKSLAENLRSIKNRDRRHGLLCDQLKPRSEPAEDATAWMTRVTDTLAAVGEVPEFYIDLFHEANEGYRTVFMDWLPRQTPHIQRSWADSVIHAREPEQSLKWIENLSTASLRRDMRDEVLSSWALRDAPEAAQYVAEKATTEEQESYLPQAVRIWALHDFASASQWLKAQPDSESKRHAMQKIGVK